MALMIFSPRGGSNLLSRMNPLIKLICLILFCAASASSSSLQLAAMLAFILILALIVHMPLFQYLIKTPSLLILTAFIFLTELAVAKNMQNAIYEASKFFFLIMLGMIMMDTTHPDDLAASIGSILSKAFGKKAWSFSSDVMLTLSMIPRIFSTSRAMLLARRARGGSFFSHPIKNLSSYTLSLFLMLLDDLKNFDLALECRLYDPLAPRRGPGYRISDISAIIIALGCFLWTKLL